MVRRRARQTESTDELLDRLGRLTERARHGVELQQARVELAEALQREMLPAELPPLPGVELAVRYSPARDGLDIGGDWYDCFVLPDGSLAVTVGDVQGHDVDAAVFMGQIRIVLRAVTLTAPHENPGQVLSRVNDLTVEAGREDLFATCSYYRLAPDGAVLSGARAGHPPMVWATAGGSSGIDADEGGLPLGITPGERYPVTRHRLNGTGAVVFLTDGVVEGPGFPVEEGLGEVQRVVGERVGSTAESIAEGVMAVAEHTGHTDDAVVLVLRYAGTGRGPRVSARP